MINLSRKKLDEKEEIITRIKRLPTVELVDLDSLPFDYTQIEDDQSILIMLFNSECSHCQYQAEEIQANINIFKSSNIIMISSESIFKIKEFANKYRLIAIPNIHLTKIREENIYPAFGNITFPHIFIYNDKGELIKEYKGETKIEALAKYL